MYEEAHCRFSYAISDTVSNIVNMLILSLELVQYPGSDASLHTKTTVTAHIIQFYPRSEKLHILLQPMSSIFAFLEIRLLIREYFE